MLKKFINFLTILLTSGILFHRCTLIGVLCGIWVYAGAGEDDSLIMRMLSPDLYLFMASFLIFYRLLFKKELTKNGDLDLQAMIIYSLGDLAWATAAMFCSVPFFMLFNYSGEDYAQKARATINPRSLMRQVPRP